MLKKRTKVLWQVAMKEATKNDYDTEENNSATRAYEGRLVYTPEKE